MSFAARVLLTTVAILAVTVGGLTLAADGWLRESLETSLQQELEREARLLAEILPREGDRLQATARRLGRVVGHRLTLIDSTGRVLGDSDFDEASLALLGNHLERPEVQDALATGSGVRRRFSGSTQRTELTVAVRAWPGVVRLSAPVARVERVVGEVQRAIVLAALLAMLVGTGLAILAGRAAARPLTRLADAARSLAAGGAPTYPVRGGPEVRQLVRAFRSMQEEITRRITQLEVRREETETLIESMVEGVVAADAGGEIVVCNTASRRLFGYGPDAPLPNLRELFHAVDARSVVNRVLDGEVVLGREILLDERTVLVTARPLPTEGAVLCLHDVTDLRRLEAVRRDFVANVSHELKTPLTSVAGYAETLLTEVPDPDTARRFLEVILTNTERMRRLVDDLLDLSTLESGAWQAAPEPLNVRRTAEAAWGPFADRAAARGVGFRPDIPDELTVLADPDAVRQILTNLYDNALRHTPEGGTIAVSASNDTGETWMEVRDTGSGIPAEHLARVFERFYRVDPGRSRDQGGTGLGLSIVRHLVEAHGGTVTLRSTVGQGTVVRVTLPD